jgi:hypothetical protein
MNKRKNVNENVVTQKIGILRAVRPDLHIALHFRKLIYKSNVDLKLMWATNKESSVRKTSMLTKR